MRACEGCWIHMGCWRQDGMLEGGALKMGFPTSKRTPGTQSSQILVQSPTCQGKP